MEISVIIPVYNVENTLKKCMDSVLCQDFCDYEIILVDDGSNDLSPQICDQYANFKNVRVIHKSNGGLGSARNAGLEIAIGKYICFVDSDDTIEKNYLRILYETLVLNDAELSICGYYYIFNRKEVQCFPKKEVINITTAIKRYVFGDSFLYFAWNKLYLADIIQNNLIRFDNKHCAEDMYFNIIYFRYINNIAFTSECGYRYRVNQNSLSNSRRKNFIEDMLLIQEALKKTCKYVNLSQKLSQDLTVILIRNSLSNYITKSSTTYQEFKQYMNCCYKKYKVRETEPHLKENGLLDRIIWNCCKKRRCLILYSMMRVSKVLKRYCFLYFAYIRKNLIKRGKKHRLK